MFRFRFTPWAKILFVLSTVFVQQVSHLFLAVIQVVVCGQLAVHQLREGLGVLHVVVSSYDRNCSP